MKKKATWLKKWEKKMSKRASTLKRIDVRSNRLRALQFEALKQNDVPRAKRLGRLLLKNHQLRASVLVD